MSVASRLSRPALRFLVTGAAVVAGLVLPSQALAQSCANAGANPNDISVDAAKAATLCLLNGERRSHGLKSLRENSRLSLASQRHTNDMIDHRYFAHGDFVGRIRAARYLSRTRGWTLGENIAWGSWDYATPASIVEGWMESPPHRANILNRKFREIGIGLTRGAPMSGQDDAATYATDFGTRY
jgi:uncharacterized protein YkwD